MLKKLLESTLFGLLSIALPLCLLNLKAVAQASGEAEKEGAEIYAKYQKAIGGKENLDKIKTVETISETEMMGSKSITKMIEDKIGKKYYSVTEGGIAGKQESGFDGERSWNRSNFFRGYRDAPARITEANVKHIKLANEMIDGKEYLVLTENLPDSQIKSSKTYYDPNTFLPFQRQTTIDIQGNIIEQTKRISDYRKVGDILIAFMEVTKSGQNTVTRKILSVKHNIEIDPAIFEFENKAGDAEKPDEKIVKTTENIPPVAKLEWDRKNPEAIVPDAVKKETFEKAWSIINDSFYDPTFNGVDWKAVKTVYEPQIAAAETNRHLTDLLNKMLGELKQSHLNISPAQNVSINGGSAETSKKGSIGLDLRLLDSGEIVTVSVRENSPAAQAGIKKGYVIKKIDGSTTAEIIAEQNKKGGFQLKEKFIAARAVGAKLQGDLDKEVLLTVSDENSKERTLKVGRKDFGARALEFDAKLLNENVGYVKFNIFIGDLLAKFAEALEKFKNTRSLIIDLRGNPGGVGDQTTALAAMLDKETRSLGSMQSRYGKQEFNFQGSEKSYQGKIFILIDELSASSSEVFAGGMQINKRAVIIGQTSAGAVLPSTVQLLPNGGAIQYAVADFKTPDGKRLEGSGVKPDTEIKLTCRNLIKGVDTALETALKMSK